MEFIYIVQIFDTLTREEADMIYDHVKEYKEHETLQGGIVFSFVNFYKGKDVERNFSFYEIDTFLRSLEIPLEFGNDKYNKNIKINLIEKLTNWIKAINKETEELYKLRKT